MTVVRTTLLDIPDLEHLDLRAETQDDGTRMYIDTSGEKYPSVTTVVGLKSRKHIKAWKKRVGEETANRMIENVVGTFPLPLGIAANFMVNKNS